MTHRQAALAAMIAVAALAAVTVLAGAVAVATWRIADSRSERDVQAGQTAPRTDHKAPGTTQTAQSGTQALDVVTFSGVADIEFGDTLKEVDAAHDIDLPIGGCALTINGVDGVDPVFSGDKLVLMWIHAPVHTPEGIMEGSSVAAVRSAYGNEIDLTAPEGSHAFPGILVTKDDRAYLFLHDGKTVRKEIVGYTDYVQRLYEQGFGAC
ncbi:MAG: hypothetical protein HOV79_18945 [Hamadaea sp.]|nr:hypothetical protein [Hamadaea sp.]